jgi:hypothetical protein
VFISTLSTWLSLFTWLAFEWLCCVCDCFISSIIFALSCCVGGLICLISSTSLVISSTPLLDSPRGFVYFYETYCVVIKSIRFVDSWTKFSMWSMRWFICKFDLGSYEFVFFETTIICPFTCISPLLNLLHIKAH